MKKTNLFFFTVIALIAICLPSEVYAQAPPPPGVPFDFGISTFVAACVGYGAYKAKKNKENQEQ